MGNEISAIQKLVNTLIEFSVNYSFQVVGALIVLFLGWMIAKWTAALLLALFEKKKLDVTFSGFLAGLVKLVIVGFAVIIALGKFGITIAPFIAALGAMIFGATYAIQGPLSNYGAGIAIILGRPFVIGDTVTVTGVSGVVDQVKLASTTLVTEDNVKITIPNKHIVGEIIQNSGPNKVVESVIGISYGDDPEKAVRVIQQVLAGFKEVTDQPPPQIGIQAFGDSSVNIEFRYWVPTRKYFQISHAVSLAVYRAVKAAGLNIPFPQREVKILSK